jgi:hypothetical protein
MRMSRILLAAVLFGLWAASPSQTIATTITTLDYPGAYFTTCAQGISGGNTVGFYEDLSGMQGFLYNGSSYTPLGVPGAGATWPLGISGSNIVGFYSASPSSGPYRGFFYNGSSYVSLDAPGAANTYPHGISGNKIVGYYTDSLYHAHSFLYDGSSYTSLSVPGAGGTEAYGIDGSNVVGYYTNSSGLHGFLYNGSSYTTLDVPGAEATYPKGISGSNIVGNYTDSTGAGHAFLYDGSSYMSLDIPGMQATYAYGISGSNIVGSYYDASGYGHGFIATIPEPSTFILLAISSITALAWGVRGRKMGAKGLSNDPASVRRQLLRSKEVRAARTARPTDAALSQNLHEGRLRRVDYPSPPACPLPRKDARPVYSSRL